MAPPGVPAAPEACTKDSPVFSMLPMRNLFLLLALVAGSAMLAGCNPIRKLHTDNQMLKARIEQLMQDRDASAAALAEHDKTVAKMQAELDAARADTQEARERFENFSKAAGSGQQGQADALARELAERTARENELRLEIDRLRAADEMAETRVMKAEADAKVAKESADLARAELDAATKRAAELDAQLAASNAKVAELQAAAEAEKKAALALAEENKKAAEAELARATSRATTREVASKTLTELLGDSARIQSDPQGTVRVVLPSDGLFQTGTVVLSDDGKKTSEDLANFIARHKINRVEVIGHTDSTPVKNMPFVDNWDLGGARAASVARALRSAAADVAVSATSRADLDPQGDNGTAEGRRQNRRVDVVLHFAD